MHLRPSHYVKLTPKPRLMPDAPAPTISQFNWLECQGKPLWWSRRVSGVVVIIFPYQSLCELCLWTCMDLYQFEPSVENHDMRKMFFPVIFLSSTLLRTTGLLFVYSLNSYLAVHCNTCNGTFDIKFLESIWFIKGWKLSYSNRKVQLKLLSGEMGVNAHIETEVSE